MKSIFKKFLNFTLATCILSLTHVVSAESLPEGLGNKARSTLADIDNAVNLAVARAEAIYENLGSNNVDISAASGYAARLINGSNPYLQSLDVVNNGLKIQLQFVGSANTSKQNSGTTYKEPVFPQLLGKRIILVPIFNYTSALVRDEKISTFECLTDADDGLKTFLNDAGLVAGRNSFISDYSDNKYLGKCKYLPVADLDAYWVSGS